jgi:hypothetical protein
MPFTSPLLFAATRELYPGDIVFVPDIGTGTSPSTSYIQYSIIENNDSANYFDAAVTFSGGDLVGLPFNQYGDFKFTLINNSLTDMNNVNSVKLRVIDWQTNTREIESPGDEVFTVASIDTLQYPSPATLTISTPSLGFQRVLSVESSDGSGTQSLNGTIRIGIKKL